MAEFKGDFLEPLVSYVDPPTGRPTMQFMIFWQKLIKGLERAFGSIETVEADVANVVGDVTDLKAPSYLVLSNAAVLTGERQFVPGNNLVVTDSGANGTYTLDCTATGAPWFDEDPPSDPELYPLWWDTTTGKLFVYYPNDGDPVWVDATPAVPGPAGDDGVDGADGAAGAAGATGSTGSAGATGATGPAAWTAVTAWLTATAYVAGPPASVVTQGGETYVCLTSHTSGTFATDLAAVKWVKVATKGTDGAGTAITAKEEGSNLTTALASINFVGTGVTATTATNDVTVTVRDFYTHRVVASTANGTDLSYAVTTSYVAQANFAFFIDLDTFVPTHFRILIINGGASASTITCQLAPFAAATTPVHSGGDDLAFSGGGASRDSGWRTFDNPAPISGLNLMTIAIKAAAGTPNLTFRSVEVHFKR